MLAILSGKIVQNSIYADNTKLELNMNDNELFFNNEDMWDWLIA